MPEEMRRYRSQVVAPPTCSLPNSFLANNRHQGLAARVSLQPRLGLPPLGLSGVHEVNSATPRSYGCAWFCVAYFGNDRSSSGRYMFPSRWSCLLAVPLLDTFICETLFLHEFSTSTRCEEPLVVNARVHLRKESKHIVLRRIVDSVSSNELFSRACGSLAPRSGLSSNFIAYARTSCRLGISPNISRYAATLTEWRPEKTDNVACDDVITRSIVSVTYKTTHELFETKNRSSTRGVQSVNLQFAVETRGLRHVGREPAPPVHGARACLHI